MIGARRPKEADPMQQTVILHPRIVRLTHWTWALGVILYALLTGGLPFVDSFVMVMSVVATFWMIQKKVECWILWIIIDVVATGVYFVKGIKFVGAEYFVFCFLAAFGLRHWILEHRSYQKGAPNPA